MTDVATKSEAQASGKDAPKTFAERGVAVPFTTGELLWARVRQKGPVKELLVPGLAKTRGIYVYEWATMRNRFALTLHDRLLHKAILTGPAPTPESIKSTALRIAASGVGGGEAKSVAEAVAVETVNLGVHTRFTLIKSVAERLGQSEVAFTVEDLASLDGIKKATDTLAQIAHVFGLTGPALYARIEELATVLTPIGIYGMALEAPPRRVVQRLNLLARALAAWADKGMGDADAEARIVSRAAAETARVAGIVLDNIDVDMGTIDLLLTEWTDRFEEMRSAASRVIWLLDGWEKFLRVWQNVSQDDKARAKALILMSYVMPLVPTSELNVEHRKNWDDINGDLAKIIALNKDGIDLETMMKLLGPEGGKPLSGVMMPAVDVATKRRRGLAPEKLTQIVRILEAAVDRPDGAPARKMLDELRPQFIQARPPRVTRPQRCVCAVFEELIVDGEASGKTSGRIPRAALTPVWSLFLERVNHEEYTAIAKQLDKQENLNQLYELYVAALQPDIDDARAFPSKARALMVRLGDESYYNALEAMVGAVTAAEPLRRLRLALPAKPIVEFSEPDLDRLSEVLNEVRRVAPSQIQTALSIVMSQMAEPWSISAVLENLATTGRFRSSAGVSGFVATAMIGQLEGQVNNVNKLAADVPEGTASTANVGETAMALAHSINQCAQSIAGTNSTLAVAGSQSQILEVEALRIKVCDLVDTKMSGGGGAVALVGAFTGKPAAMTPAGTVRPGTRWRFDEPLEGAALRNAELYAEALKQSEQSAGALGLGSKVAKNIEETLEEFEKTTTVLFSQMRTAGLDRITREYAKTHVAGIARVVEILAGSERGERILDKGLEAIG
jgi:hypothetical protein